MCSSDLWTFIVWGALHGFYLIFAIISQKPRQKLNEWSGITRIPWLFTLTQILITYSLVTFAWIFFRANNIKDALYIAGKIPSALYTVGRLILTGHILPAQLEAALGTIPVYHSDLILSFILIGFLEVVHVIQRKYNVTEHLGKMPRYQRWALYYGMIAVIIFFGVYQNRQFIYFQF